MNKNLLELEGRIVMVAGAGGGGLGTHVTRLAAEAGATVIGVSRSQENLDRHLGPMIDEGLSVIPVAADMETEEGVSLAMAAATDAAKSGKGELYGLVCIIGGGPPPTWGPATKVSRSTWSELFSKNLESMFFISQAFAAELKQQNKPGSIVAIASITAVASQPFNIAYGAAKAAVLSVVRTMALELASSNIRVNAIAPGAILMPSSLLPPDPELEAQAIPMGRKGEVQEIGGTALFLLSDLAGYMTGQTLIVDGGITLKGSHLGDDNTPKLITNEDFLRLMKGE